MSIPVHCAHTRLLDPNSLKPNPVNPNRHNTNDQPNTPANATLVLINTIGLITGAATAKATPKLTGAPR